MKVYERLAMDHSADEIDGPCDRAMYGSFKAGYLAAVEMLRSKECSRNRDKSKDCDCITSEEDAADWLERGEEGRG